MKKYISLSMLAAMFLFAACDVETDVEPGGTAVEKAAGFWTVTTSESVDEYLYVYENTGSMPDESNIEKWEWEDLFGYGSSTISTYNTAANVATEIWFDDSNFFGAKIKADLDYENLTFSAKATDNTAADGQVRIISAKILPGAATTPSGVAADSIVVYTQITGNSYTSQLTYVKYSGFRYTGFAADE